MFFMPSVFTPIMKKPYPPRNCFSLKNSQKDRSQKFWKIIHEAFLPYVIKMMSSAACLEFSQDHLQILLRHKPLNCISYKCSFCEKGYVQPYGLEVGGWRYFICLICGKWEAKQIPQTKKSKKRHHPYLLSKNL